MVAIFVQVSLGADPLLKMLKEGFPENVFLQVRTLSFHNDRGGSGGPAGTVLAGPLFEFLTLLLAINHYKPTN